MKRIQYKIVSICKKALFISILSPSFVIANNNFGMPIPVIKSCQLNSQDPQKSCVMDSVTGITIYAQPIHEAVSLLCIKNNDMNKEFCSSLDYKTICRPFDKISSSDNPKVGKDLICQSRGKMKMTVGNIQAYTNVISFAPVHSDMPQEGDNVSILHCTGNWYMDKDIDRVNRIQCLFDAS